MVRELLAAAPTGFLPPDAAAAPAGGAAPGAGPATASGTSSPATRAPGRVQFGMPVNAADSGVNTSVDSSAAGALIRDAPSSPPIHNRSMPSGAAVFNAGGYGGVGYGRVGGGGAGLYATAPYVPTRLAPHLPAPASPPNHLPSSRLPMAETLTRLQAAASARPPGAGHGGVYHRVVLEQREDVSEVKLELTLQHSNRIEKVRDAAAAGGRG
ncbi:hypothetical protein GPECTOR_2g1416 [Gonium pectorale]|uniref:Uncharacterized protein n=1 Tax=Gonium pectorale TaxID=33097 RepID=A0A150H1B6_GONPE|nr:hypothetical protein GPECTOR_2g1416 [Gonium pectorale]|eukprot:KXZ55865.1 hypothetical protein GPECTOR_2g1416 [Gonium pectorale]